MNRLSDFDCPECRRPLAVDYSHFGVSLWCGNKACYNERAKRGAEGMPDEWAAFRAIENDALAEALDREDRRDRQLIGI